MYPLSIIAVLFLIFGGLTLSNYERALVEANAAHVTITSQQMRVYGRYVAAYAKANPAFVGTVADTDANLPGWLVRDPEMSNRAVAGTAIVFYRSTSIAEAYAFARECKRGVTCGVVRSGKLYAPGVQNPIFLGASEVPDGSTAIVFF